jgi:cobalt-zinc-cadmium efflux system protein
MRLTPEKQADSVRFMVHSHCSHAVQGKALYGTLFIALTFMAIEVAGGILASSLALYSDALHLLMDAGALILALIVLKIAHLPRTSTMSYGYHRAEVLGALANALSLWILCALLIYEAFKRLNHPHDVKGPIVLFVAAIGVVANLIMIRRVHPTQGHNLNMRAVYLHILGDLLGSIGVLLSGAILWFTGWNPIDPIITLLFTVAIIYSSWKVIAQSIKILMESTPQGVDPLSIERDLQAINGVTEVHDLHIWTVASHRIAMSVHLVTTRPQAVLNEAHHMLEKKHDIQHMTIQVEDPSSFEPKFCYDCDPRQKK